MVVNSISCKTLVGGNAQGEILFSRSPISFIGGVDPKTGIIMDPQHDQFQQCIADKIFIFPYGKGSSGAGLVLLELARIHKAPKAIVNLRSSTVILTGPLVIREFYKKTLPLLNVTEEDMHILSTARYADIQYQNDATVMYVKDNEEATGTK